MNIKWYWPMQMLGLIRYTVGGPKTKYHEMRVSIRCGDVFRDACLAFLVILFLAGLLLRRSRVRRVGPDGGRLAVRIGIGILLFCGLMKGVGIGPYIEWYPGQRSGGFLDLSAIDHVIEGIWFAILSLSLWLGGRVGARLGRRKYNNAYEDREDREIQA